MGILTNNKYYPKVFRAVIIATADFCTAGEYIPKRLNTVSSKFRNTNNWWRDHVKIERNFVRFWSLYTHAILYIYNIYVYMSDVRVFALPVLMLLLPTHPRGIKFPFWVLRVRPPSTDPFNISRGMYTVELASVFRARDAGPGNKLKSSSRENYYTTSNKYNFVKFRHLLYTRRSRSFRHNIIPQPFSGFFSVHDRCHNCFP